MSSNGQNPAELLIRKIRALSQLNSDDRIAIERLQFTRGSVSAGHYLVNEGDIVTDCCLLLDGYACRHKVAENGGRQIGSFHMRGDVVDLQHFLLTTADHNVQTITPANVAWIKGSDLRTLIHRQPMVAEALWKDTLIDASIFREWVVNVGRRDAKSRIAHMLCEFVSRCEAAGLGTPTGFDLPFTQEQIADATGLTPVHVNRMIRALREDGVTEIGNGNLRVIDWSGLRKIAGFDAAYLHRAAA